MPNKRNKRLYLHIRPSIDQAQLKEFASSTKELPIRVFFSHKKTLILLEIFFCLARFLMESDPHSLGEETLHDNKAERKVDRRRA